MTILGIDEVGRGPLAGPLVVGAVILPEEKLEWVGELKDSKKLSVKKRERLNEVILREASATGVGWVTAVEIDKVGIAEALKMATRRAVKSVQRLHAPFNQVVIDGKVNFLKGTKLEAYVSNVVKADDLIKEVSAASIIAKVARDSYMVEMARKYPEYGFETHVGYGTAKHIEAIRKFGVCPEHRLSFEPCKSLVGFDRVEGTKKNTTKIGRQGEESVAKYLMQRGHKIVARNHRTRFYEIDIVSSHDGKIYFTEVKYRRTGDRGGGLAAITAKKKQQMEFAAKSFLKLKTGYTRLDPKLAVAEVVGEDFAVKDWFSLSE